MLRIAGNSSTALLIQGEVVSLPSCRFSGCVLSFSRIIRMGTYKQSQLFVGESL
jgi:hypothetical protein